MFKRSFSLPFLFGGLLFFPTGFAFANTGETTLSIDPLWILPFGILLASIATLPLLAKHFWEKYYGAVAVGLGLLVVGYYLFGLGNPGQLLITGHEYISFICLIGSLFVVTGGILIRIWRPGTPLVNLAILGIGAVVANLFGTTGASALLIRPFIRVNRGRLKPYHIVFFIFAVSNMGGLLTPVGDPPLFLGYIKGVPFFWLFEHVWYIWLFANGLVLSIFFVIDYRNKDQAPAIVQPKGHQVFEIIGMHNFAFLAMIIVAVLFNSALPPFVPEAIQVLAAYLAYKTTSKVIRKDNDFSFGPIKEVALLFVGIFATMIPALQYLEGNASQLGIETPGLFYWFSGALSSVLDNAPTYLTFLSAAFGLHGGTVESGYQMHWLLGMYTNPGMPLIPGDAVVAFDQAKALPTLMAQHASGYFPKPGSMIYVIAISVASVFFGANTYIGNGPNFMVKSIAEELGCETPSFFGYILKYSLPVLIPVFFLVWLIWFRG